MWVCHEACASTLPKPSVLFLCACACRCSGRPLPAQSRWAAEPPWALRPPVWSWAPTQHPSSPLLASAGLSSACSLLPGLQLVRACVCHMFIAAGAAADARKCVCVFHMLIIAPGAAAGVCVCVTCSLLWGLQLEVSWGVSTRSLLLWVQLHSCGGVGVEVCVGECSLLSWHGFMLLWVGFWG